MDVAVVSEPANLSGKNVSPCDVNEVGDTCTEKW